MDPEILEAVAGRRLPQGRLLPRGGSGQHTAHQRGSLGEFREHRAYLSGDDLRHLDWRVAARTGAYCVRQYDDEANRVLHLLVDVSGSMDFGSSLQRRKHQVATKLALALSWLALRQGDAVGLQFAGDGDLPSCRPQAHPSHFSRLAGLLGATSPEGPTRLVNGLRRLQAQRLQPGCLVVLTDLFDPDPQLLPCLAQFAGGSHDVAVLQVLDPQETTFALPAPVQLHSMEDKQTVFVDPLRSQKSLQQAMQQRLTLQRDGLRRAGIWHQQLFCQHPLRRLLADFLGRR
jgi:uncharacterized protein (DUF58 family)